MKIRSLLAVCAACLGMLILVSSYAGKVGAGQVDPPAKKCECGCDCCKVVIPQPMAGPGHTFKVMGDDKPAGANVAGKFQPIRAKLAKARAKIIEGLVSQGVDRADATLVVGELGDGTLIRFLIEHFDDILAIVLKLLPLFLDKAALAAMQGMEPGELLTFLVAHLSSFDAT